MDLQTCRNTAALDVSVASGETKKRCGGKRLVSDNAGVPIVSGAKDKIGHSGRDNATENHTRNYSTPASRCPDERNDNDGENGEQRLRHYCGNREPNSQRTPVPAGLRMYQAKGARQCTEKAKRTGVAHAANERAVSP